MASIQTPNRLIKVKESYEEVLYAITNQWMELTEDTTFYGELGNKYYEGERKIWLNVNYIIEVQP